MSSFPSFRFIKNILHCEISGPPAREDFGGGDRAFGEERAVVRFMFQRDRLRIGRDQDLMRSDDISAADGGNRYVFRLSF